MAALNGLAGVVLLEGRHAPAACADAVRLYRAAIAAMEAGRREGIDTDPLQRLHTLHNLALLLKPPPPSPSHVALTEAGGGSDKGGVRPALPAPAAPAPGSVSTAYPHLPGIPRTLRDDELGVRVVLLLTRFVWCPHRMSPTV